MALIRTTALASALVLSFPLHAQVAPDAGRTLQETVPPVQAPRPSPEITIEPPSDAAVAPEGGVRVTLQSVGRPFPAAPPYAFSIRENRP